MLGGHTVYANGLQGYTQMTKWKTLILTPCIQLLDSTVVAQLCSFSIHLRVALCPESSLLVLKHVLCFDPPCKYLYSILYQKVGKICRQTKGKVSHNLISPTVSLQLKLKEGDVLLIFEHFLCTIF